MKKIYSLLMIVSILIAAIVPASAQKVRDNAKSVIKNPVEATRFSVSEAFSDGRGVFVRWSMSVESDNIGFNVYRVGESGQRAVNDGIILGSNAHYAGRTAYGETYSFYDPSGNLGDIYVIESIGANGSRMSSGKVGAAYTYDMNQIAGHSVEQLLASETKKKASLASSTLDLPGDLGEEVKASRSAPEPKMQSTLAALNGVKLGIRTDGFYRVTKAELLAAGFDTNADSNLWQLFLDGVEQAILVAPNGDYVEFVGKARETIETDIRYYYLTVGGSAGKRMATRVSRPIGSTTVATNFQQTLVTKQRTNYIDTIINGDADNFWGNAVSSTASSFTFNLPGVDLTGPNALVLIKFQGFSTTTHSIGLALNGQALPPVSGSGQTPFSTTATVPASALRDGLNTLEMTSGASNDYSLFDSISVGFARKHKADQNQIPFYTINYRGARITGFSTPNIRLFDTTQDGNPQQMLNLNIAQNGATYDINLPPNRGRVMYAVENSAIKSVASVVFNSPSTLATTAHNANLVIITYGDFAAQANAWATYRRQQGITVEVVDVADIFDEFNYGQSSSVSIRNFLQYAVTNWQTPPGYALLLGDASFDPKNYYGFGYLNLVPSKIVNTNYSEVGSDEALADFNGDGLAEVAIGRIPAATADVVTNALAKVQAFEHPALQDFNRGAIFAYDLPIGYDFAGMSTTLRNNLPANMPTAFVDRGAPNSTPTLISEINNGRYIVNYAGHGNAGGWASNGFFRVSDIPSLTNANTQSIFTMLTCLNGAFMNPFFDGIAEKLLKAQNGGAVAAWASTGETTPDIQLIMGNRFYNQLAAGNMTRFGDLIRDAKSVIPGGTDVRFSWALLGDPMLKVRP